MENNRDKQAVNKEAFLHRCIADRELMCCWIRL
jgi:hypothetical protein